MLYLQYEPAGCDGPLLCLGRLLVAPTTPVPPATRRDCRGEVGHSHAQAVPRCKRRGGRRVCALALACPRSHVRALKPVPLSTAVYAMPLMSLDGVRVRGQSPGDVSLCCFSWPDRKRESKQPPFLGNVHVTEALRSVLRTPRDRGRLTNLGGWKASLRFWQ